MRIRNDRLALSTEDDHALNTQLPVDGKSLTPLGPFQGIPNARELVAGFARNAGVFGGNELVHWTKVMLFAPFDTFGAAGVIGMAGWMLFHIAPFHVTSPYKDQAVRLSPTQIPPGA